MNAGEFLLALIAIFLADDRPARRGPPDPNDPTIHRLAQPGVIRSTQDRDRPPPGFIALSAAQNDIRAPGVERAMRTRR